MLVMPYTHQCLGYSPKGIPSSFMLTISPFGINGNIDEKHLGPKKTKQHYATTIVVILIFSNPLHQSNLKFTGILLCFIFLRIGIICSYAKQLSASLSYITTLHVVYLPHRDIPSPYLHESF